MSNINRFTYTIDQDGAVSIFDAEYPTGTSAPNIYQPGHPASINTPWESKEVAEKWAKEYIENLLNPPVIPEYEESLDTNVIEVVPAE